MVINKKIIKNGLVVLSSIFAYKTIDSYVSVSGWDYQTLALVTFMIMFFSWVVFK